MNKKEITKRLDFLRWAVKTRGRAYSAKQREEMKEEIRTLQNALEKIKFEEDREFIKEFEKKHPYDFKYLIDSSKSRVYGIMENINNATLAFVLMPKATQFLNEVDKLEYYKGQLPELKQALKFLVNNKEIPFSNDYSNKKKDEIQKYLSSKYKNISSVIDNLDVYLSQIRKLNDFYHYQRKLEGFVYLTDAIFKDATDFDKGYSIVTDDTQNMYFTFKGEIYNLDTDENDLPKINLQRENPDLTPFEIEDEEIGKLMGYKNSKDEIIVPAKYKKAYPFVNGFAKVGIYKLKWNNEQSERLTYGLLDSEGKQVLPCEFIELGNVYNDIVHYKKHVYKDDYVRESAFNYNVKHQVSHLGFLSGFLILEELKPTISNEIEIIQKTQDEIQALKTVGEVDNAYEKIKYHKNLIELYLKTVLLMDTTQQN